VLTWAIIHVSFNRAIQSLKEAGMQSRSKRSNEWQEKCGASNGIMPFFENDHVSRTDEAEYKVLLHYYEVLGTKLDYREGYAVLKKLCELVPDDLLAMDHLFIILIKSYCQSEKISDLSTVLWGKIEAKLNRIVSQCNDIFLSKPGRSFSRTTVCGGVDKQRSIRFIVNR
jgi:hypothetical protein